MSRVTKFLLFTVVLPFVLLVGPAIWSCRPVTRSELVPSYSCTYPYGTEILKLSPDGTYTQTVGFSSGRVLNNHGNWTVDRNNDLVLNDALVVDNAFGAPRSDLGKGGWILRAGHTLTGKVYLIVNEDLAFYFR